jgi:hypothetical protein
MAEYLLQIEDATQRLIKCYEITAENPRRTVVPEGRTQIIITDTKKFNDAVAAYNEHLDKAKFSPDGDSIKWDIV